MYPGLTQVSRKSSSGLAAEYAAAVLALSPTRYYQMNDFIASGSMADTGSAGINGTYPSSGMSDLSPGLAPYDTRHAVFANGGSASFANTGLMTGAAHWTIGLTAMPTLYNASVVTPLSVNGVGFLFGTNQIQLFYPGGDLGLTVWQGPNASVPYLWVGTYDGSTVRWYFNGLQIGSAGASLNLSAGSCWVGAGGQSGCLVQDCFIIDGTAINSTQVATLASKWLGH